MADIHQTTGIYTPLALRMFHRVGSTSLTLPTKFTAIGNGLSLFRTPPTPHPPKIRVGGVTPSGKIMAGGVAPHPPFSNVGTPARPAPSVPVLRVEFLPVMGSSLPYSKSGSIRDFPAAGGGWYPCPLKLDRGGVCPVEKKPGGG